MTSKIKHIIDNGLLENIEQSKAYALSDSDIRLYLPGVKILKYSELKNYNNITELLPHDKSYAIILYLDSPSTGHWVAIMRYKKNNKNYIEFFDSYGLPIDNQKSFVDKKTRQKLNVDRNYMKELMNQALKDGFTVVYNPIKYQNDDFNDINTCGRFVIYRILKMLDGMDGDQFLKHMKTLKNKYKINSDTIVTSIIR